MHITHRKHPGFTLIELLIVIGILGVLAAIVFYFMNPGVHFAAAQDAMRMSNAKTLEKAMYQRLVDEWELLNVINIPEGETNAKPICRLNTDPGDGSCVVLDDLIPTYIADLPVDPAETNENYTGYIVYKKSGRVHVDPDHLGETGGGGTEDDGETTSIAVIPSFVPEFATFYPYPRITRDGRYIVFSVDKDLVAQDTNGTSDIYLSDTQTNQLELISISGTEGSADNFSGFPSISDDGRYVAFVSFASNLITNDTNLASDIFVRDRQTDTTTRISVTPGGAQVIGSSTKTAMSTDGRYIAFTSNASTIVAGDTNASTDVFVRDTQLNTTTLVSRKTDDTLVGVYSDLDSISGDGRYVVFESPGVFDGADSNGEIDVFVRDTQSSLTTRVSVATGGAQGNGISAGASISDDGNYVAFVSSATNLVASDTNDVMDIFLHIVSLQETRRVSVASDGTQANEFSMATYITPDASKIAFDSTALTLVPGDLYGMHDVFVHTLATGETIRVNLAEGGLEGNANSYLQHISADGRKVLFTSDATNLVPGDTNGGADLFLVTY